MSRMKELYMDQVENDYALYVESLNQDLRHEGAEELRNDIVRSIQQSIAHATDDGVRYGLTIALNYVIDASI
jgi:hypothetical protein